MEIGKSPIIPSLSTLENSESESPSSNDTSSKEGREGNVSAETGGGRGSGNTGKNDTGSYPRTAASSTSTRIELTELYESDLSFD